MQEENLHDDKGEEVTKEASRSNGLSQVPKDRQVIFKPL